MVIVPRHAAAARPMTYRRAGRKKLRQFIDAGLPQNLPMGVDPRITPLSLLHFGPVFHHRIVRNLEYHERLGVESVTALTKQSWTDWIEFNRGCAQKHEWR